MARMLSLAALALMLRACAAQGGNPTRFYSSNNIPPIGPEVITSVSLLTQPRFHRNVVDVSGLKLF
jgi:hypothetical protein